MQEGSRAVTFSSQTWKQVELARSNTRNLITNFLKQGDPTRAMLETSLAMEDMLLTVATLEVSPAAAEAVVPVQPALRPLPRIMTRSRADATTSTIIKPKKKQDDDEDEDYEDEEISTSGCGARTKRGIEDEELEHDSFLDGDKDPPVYSVEVYEAYKNGTLDVDEGCIAFLNAKGAELEIFFYDEDADIVMPVDIKKNRTFIKQVYQPLLTVRSNLGNGNKRQQELFTKLLSAEYLKSYFTDRKISSKETCALCGLKKMCTKKLALSSLKERRDEEFYVGSLCCEVAAAALAFSKLFYSSEIVSMEQLVIAVQAITTAQAGKVQPFSSSKRPRRSVK